MTRYLFVWISALFLGLAPGEEPPRPVPEKTRIERLARLGRAWGTVRYLHPFLAYRELDWDAPLVKAIPKVEAAKTPAEYAAAVREMLAALDDPATHVVLEDSQDSKPAQGAPPPLSTWVDGKILVVRLTDIRSFAGDPLTFRNKVEQLRSEIATADGGLFDLRALAPGAPGGWIANVFERLGSLLVAREVVGPSQRTVAHSGYMPQTGTTSGGYFSAFVASPSTRFLPDPVAGNGCRRVAFVVNARSELPEVALAAQAAGNGAIIAEGPISDALLATTMPLDLGEGVTALVRVSELIGGPEGPDAVQPDIEVAPSEQAELTAPSYAAALKYLRHEREINRPGRLPRPQPLQPVFRPDRTYGNQEYPERAYRLLGAIRFWNVIHYFFPYKHLIEEGWDSILERFLPKVEAARDAREYALAIAEMGTHTHDSHVFVRSMALAEHFGRAAPSVFLREIEGEPVVTWLGKEPSLKDSGLEVGDVVLKVDDQPVRERMAELARYTTASTPQALTHRVLDRLLAGPADSRVTLLVRDRDGRERERRLLRTIPRTSPTGVNDQPVLRLLEGNLGYADLTRLNVAQVDEMFEQFQKARGIIFDMRGYPRGTAWAIAPRINTKGARDAADFRRPLVGGGGFSNGSYHFLQPIPPLGGKTLYRGKTVMLIDERAISQSEHTGLFFEAANGTTFIGSPTAGANGDITTLTLPGGIVISFSGHDVRHADGRQLQRVGLRPHIEVRPTLRGIREGPDEVLEAARSFLLDTGPGAAAAKP
jgi:C-terminal processing protease CtpA/Prc